MATILLAAAGSALGGMIGGVGAVVGQAIGGVLGNLIDRSLIRAILPAGSGPRLTDLDVLSSTEGDDVPRVYGRARLAGQLIWATRHEETASTSGGKGGPSVESWTYHANFAVALCEGPIDHVGRIWADGQLLDTTGLTIRVHFGGGNQAPDALIRARQGGDVPAYRGIAYVVFEHFPLETWGNRIPQLSFEVIRAVDTLEAKVRGVTMIPGGTEFGYATTAVDRASAPGETVSENRHVLHAATDFVAALDELVALCPNLKRVALVVTWFGDDLRVGHCRLRPSVEQTVKSTRGAVWSVAGVDRASARLVSRHDDRPAYGGTPSDRSVVEAITEIRSRGLEVMLYPFIAMDIPAGNGLIDPYGGPEQAAHPWRGRITCHPAPGRPGCPLGTVILDGQVQPFVGDATPTDYAVVGGEVVYSGPAEWTLRRMILHYAHLAKAAGGVDVFLLGSELVGLTQLYGSGDRAPFVASLVDLAADVRSVVGQSTKLSYGADWTEWNAITADDGSGDVFFRLDPLWASPAIDFVGIDTYFPLTDWRRGDHLDAELADRPTDRAYLAAGVAGGEGFDWYYADEAGRRAQTRLPITDGAYGKPWIFRPKDLVAWWSNLHYDRPGGIENTRPTAWRPGMKPIWLTELGCPAVDLGANQPNVFPDPKSSESHRPWFSIGTRDDLAQRRALEAVLDHWNPTLAPENNPVSAVYGDRMMPLDGIHLWTWDARPFPVFPTDTDTWADGDVWSTGHWLNGRLGGTSVEALIRAVLADHGVSGAAFRAVAGHVDGYVIDRRMSARDALEPLVATFQIDAVDTGTGLRFCGRDRRGDLAVTSTDCAEIDRRPLVEIRRAQESELPGEVTLAFSDASLDHRRAAVASRRLEGTSRRIANADLALIAPVECMVGVADTWLADVWSGRTSYAFALDPTRIAVEPGDIVDLTIGDRSERVLIESIADGAERRIEARSLDTGAYGPVRAVARRRVGLPATAWGQPLVVVLDIAHADEDGAAHRPWVAAFATPWPGSLAIWRRRDEGTWKAVGRIDRQARVGVTASPLAPGPSDRWDMVNHLDVTLWKGTLSAASQTRVLAGECRVAVRAPNGLWEVLQYGAAEMIGASSWRLSHLLRNQGGSEDVWAGLGEIPAGATFVVLDEALRTLPLDLVDLDDSLTFRIGSAFEDYTRPSHVEIVVDATGRGLRSWSPAHLRAVPDPASGDVRISWIRRSRGPGADAWGAGEVPLPEGTESYRLEILLGSTLVRRVETTSSIWVWPRADRDAHLGAAPVDVTVRVAQIAPTVGPGVWASDVFRV